MDISSTPYRWQGVSYNFMDHDPFKGGGLIFYFWLPLQQQKT
jgi:hypothetical protein